MSRGTVTPAYIGLGSNLGNPLAQIKQAVRALDNLTNTRLIVTSAIYRSAPMGSQDQPDFLNAVAGVLTARLPEDLLAGLQKIENAQGRCRDGTRWGPRTLDLDLLLFGSVCIDSASLTIPHPGVYSRPFVLVPLAEVAPGLYLPDGTRVARLADELGRRGVVRVGN